MFPLLLLIHAQAHPPDSALQKALNAAKPGETVQLPAGPIQWPLRVEGAQNLRIVAQPDTVLNCGDDQRVPCLLIQDSQDVRVEGLQIAGHPRRNFLLVQDSTGVVLDGIRVHRGTLRVDNAQLLIQNSTLSDLDSPMLATHTGGAELEITASYLIGISFYPARQAPDWLHLHHNNLTLSQNVQGANSHHNLIQGWPASRPTMDRNLRMLDPGFVDPGRGDLRVQSLSSALEGFGVPGPRVSVGDELALHSPALFGVLGWSRDGVLLAYTEPLDTGHGLCATELILWDASAQERVDSVGCAFDEGPFSGEMALLEADYFAPILSQAEQAGVRAGLGTAAQVQTRTTFLEELETDSETGMSKRRSLLWIDRGQQGLDPWWEITEDFEFGLPYVSTTLTRSPDGAQLIWVMGDQLIAVPELPKPQATCGVKGMRRGQQVLPEKNGAELYITPGQERWGGHSGPIRYAGRVSCERSGEGKKAGVWVQVLDRMDSVFWVHSSQLAQPLAWTDPVENPLAPKVSFSPLQSPRPLSQDSVDLGWAVLGWSPDGVVLAHAGLAPTLLASNTTLLDTRTAEVLASVAHTWPEHDPSSYQADYWAREAVFAELLALANAKEVRADIGHTQKVLLAEKNPPQAFCLNDGSGWRAYTSSEPLHLDVDLGPWLSTGPGGVQVLVMDDGQVVTVSPAAASCPDQPATD